MVFSDAELVDLRSRCLTASQRGYIIGLADEYMKALGAEGPSAAQLFEAADLEMQARLSGGKVAKKEAPKVEEPKVEAKVEEPVKAEEPKAEEPAKVEEPVKAESKSRGKK